MGDSQPSADRARSRPTVPRWWVVAVVLVVVAAAGGWAAWWRTHPSQSFEGGYGMELERRVGEPVWTVLVHRDRPGAEQVRITDLEPRFRVDEADVEVQYLICELDEAALKREGVGSFGYGAREGALERYCTHTREARGATFALRADPPQELLVGITPTRPGRTVVTGHRLSFEVGWQVGSDDLEVETQLTARDGGPRR